jgi:hypothetical protein
MLEAHAGQRSRGLWWQEAQIPKGPDMQFQGKAIASDEYLSDHWSNCELLQRSDCEALVL